MARTKTSLGGGNLGGPDDGSGNILAKDAAELTIFTIDGTNRKVTFPSGATLDVSAATNTLGAVAATSVTSTGLVKSSSATAGVGYAVGAGGTIAQATNRSTGVTLSKVTGTITTDTTSLAAAAAATFTVTNTAVAINDVIVLSIRSGQTNKETKAYVSAVAAGSFDITVHNQHASVAEVGAIIINFTVLKGVVT